VTANKKIIPIADFSVGDFVLWDLTNARYLKFGLSDSVSEKKYGVVVKVIVNRGAGRGLGVVVGIKIKFNDGETLFFSVLDPDLDNMIILEKAKQ
jgi:hypothetical protein